MTVRLRRLPMRLGHARPRTLSRYVDGELRRPQRLALEAHLRACRKCGALHESLSGTVQALASMRPSARPGLSNSIIAALRAQSPAPTDARGRSPLRAASPVLTVLPGTAQRAADRSLRRNRLGRLNRRWRHILHGSRVRVILPIALIVGVTLSLVNQGGMLLGGHIDLEMCAICGLNFVIPFVALNVVLLVAKRLSKDWPF
jgi:anti-sigma factor RsiW